MANALPNYTYNSTLHLPILRIALVPSMNFISRTFALFFAFSLSGQAAQPTFEYRLQNGLKLIVKPDRRAPVVVSQIWYRVGSMDEINGKTGVAHVLEHMMFKGTKAVPAGEFSRLIAQAGGRENAFTSLDYTAYFQQLAKEKLPLALRLEADRMRNLRISDAEFAKEIKVVMEERRGRTEDEPQAQVYENLASVAFRTSPYRNPIIGWMSDLQAMNADDARAWYDVWYAPNNATLVIVGDVEPEAVQRLAKQYFGAIRTASLPLRTKRSEPTPRGIQRIVVKAPAKLPSLLMAYHVPNLINVQNDVEPYALEMLAGVLDAGASSRLTQRVVRERRIANEVGASYDSISRLPSLFTLNGVPSEGKSVAELEAALRAEIDEIKQKGVGQEELERMKAQIIAAQVYQRDSMFYQAMVIGEFETVGHSHRDIDIVNEKLKQITPEQVQAVARKYLIDDALTVAVLEPQPLETTGAAKPVAGGHGR